MRKNLTPFLLCVCMMWPYSLAQQGVVLPEGEATLLENLRVIVGDGEVLQDGAVLFQGDTILAVGRPTEIAIPEGTTRISLEGKTLLPALIDAHAHLGYDNLSTWSGDNYSLENVQRNLEIYAYFGFGAVFSAGSDPLEVAQTLQEQQADDQGAAARFFFAAGMAPPGQGPNGQFLVEALEVEQRYHSPLLRGLSSPEQAVDAVNTVEEQGIAFIKLWVDDRGGTQEKLQPEVYRALIAEAQRHVIPTWVHQQNATDMLDLIDAGVHGFLHGRLERDFTQEIARAAKQKNVFIVPNLGLAELRREALAEDPFLVPVLSDIATVRLGISEQRLRQVQRNAVLEQTLTQSFRYLREASVDVVLGTDAGAVPDHPFGYTGHRELEIFVRHGMSTAEAINAATTAAARALGLENTGAIRPGFRADLLVLDSNPLEDIRNTRTIHRVYLGGQLIDREALVQKQKSIVMQ